MNDVTEAADPPGSSTGGNTPGDPAAPATLVVRTKDDISDFVNSHPSGTRRTKLLAFIALGGIFVDAYDFTSLSIGIDSLTEQWHLTPFEVGSTTAVMAVGALVGALGGGYLADRLGRYKLFVLDLVLFVAAALGAGLAPNLPVLLVCRLLLGIGVGLDMPVAFSFITEFTSRHEKGKYVNLWQSVWYVAVVATGAFVLPFHLLGAGGDLWRWAVGFGAVPAVVVLVLRLNFTEESPMWAAHRLGLREAAAILEKSYHIRVEVAPSADADEKQAAEGAKEKVRLRAIFEGTFRPRTILASTISMTQAAQYFAVGFYTPTITALLFGAGTLYTILGTMVINLFGVLGGTVQPFLTHRLGLRKLAFAGYVIVAASMLALAAVDGSGLQVLPALLIGVLIFGHSFGPGAQGKTMASLSYPTEFRGLGTGWSEAMSRVGTIAGFYLFPLVLAAVGLGQTMLYLTLVPLIGLAALLLIRWEPVGKDVETREQPRRAPGERQSA